MGTRETLDRSGMRMPMVLKRAFVIGVALAAIGYGMARMGAHSPASPAQAAMAGHGQEATVPRPASPEDRVQREEDPRPCQAELGITERCTY